ncbi:glycosyltransferase [Proteus sp. G2669]|uniref:Gt4 n=1 Tax=Proteus penneri TaxID=102862 RepID=A0A385JP17_9GAMM|nr:glycosyltransferase family A protein [Proteus sp. G2669]AXZ00048.1 gt4 [Proteus penneri]NBM53725.1 glycosyltransferase [Proteus sp. G2669]
MKVEFLVATTNRTDLKFIDRIFQNINIDDIYILVINQCIDIPLPSKIDIPHDNIRVLSVTEKGTSVSRNLAIKNMIGDICTFTDDDLIYEKGIIEKIINNFQQKNTDIITFKTGIINSNKDIKYYKNNHFKHTFRSLLSIGDWEIFFKSNIIKAKNILLDERFGLGCKYPACEYHIFITDCYKKGIDISYIPIVVVRHPDIISTGLKFTPILEISRGAGFARILGYKSLIASIFFAIKKHPLYKEKHSFFKECYFLIKGNIKILLSKKK